MRVTAEPEELHFVGAIPADAIAVGLERGDDGEFKAVVVALQAADNDWQVYRTSAHDARQIAHALLEKAALLDDAELRKGILDAPL